MVSGRAANVQNNIRFNSLRSREKKFHSISPKGGGVLPTTGTSEVVPHRREVSFSLSGLLSSWMRGHLRPAALTLAGSSSP